MEESKQNIFAKNKKLFFIIAGILLVAAISFVAFNLYDDGQEIEYNISFATNGGSSVESVTVNKNNTITKPQDPVKEGYTFLGWYYNNELYDFNSRITGDIELEARWKKIEKVTSIKLNRSTIILYVGSTSKLIATVMPENADNKNVTWKSTASDIVSVDADGNIKSLKEGNATIIATTEDGGYTAKVQVLARKAVIQGSIVESDNYQKSTYTVTFKDTDGSTLFDTQTIKYGEAATEPTNPTKQGYTFLGWYNGKTKYSFSSKVKSNLTLTAKWKANKYNITFVNYDGTVLQTKAVSYGAVPIYTKSVPTKASTEQYEYVFAGWSPALTTVAEDATYTATFTEALRNYEVTFVDQDGTILADAQTIAYGSKAVKPADPTKPGHTFIAWYNGDTEYTFDEEVKSNVTLTAKWEINKYTVTFVNFDGTVLETQSVEYGTVPTYTQSEPTKEGNNTYTYSFNGWDKELAPITQDITYTATFAEKFVEYVITFVNEDGTVLSKQTYHYTDTIVPPANPTKAPTEQYEYVFAGWSPELTTVTEDATYTATYTESLRNYTVTFVDQDGTNLADAQTITYGNKAVKPADPTKTGHTFIAWYNGDTEYTFNEEVKGNVTLTAKWEANKYTITFVNYDGSVLETKSVEYGTTPEYSKDTPTKAPNGQYKYIFAGWSPALTAVTEDATYTATFTETLRNYTVTFVDQDGTTLADAQTIFYGNKAVKPADPTKTGHTFIAWYNGDTEYTFEETIDADLTLTAKWEVNKYTVTFVNYDGSVLETKSVEYGTTPEYTGKTPTKASNVQYSYEFNGWSPALASVEGDTTYTAVFTEKLNSYTVTFVDQDGTKLADAQTITYGNKATKPADPKKEGHTFIAWYNGDAEYTFEDEVKGNLTLTAKWEANKYTITFVNYDGSVLETQSVEYGSTPKYTGKTPTKPSDTTYSYSFTGWDPSVTAVKQDTKYTAVFKSYVDIDQRIENAISGVNAKEFKVAKNAQTINVTFTSYKENGRTIKPPYDLLDIASDVTGLLSGLANDPTYKSVLLEYKGKTLEATDYTLNDAASWLAHVCGKSGGMFGLLTATTKHLVGKTITIKITLKDGYVTESGGTTATFNLTFANE